MGLMTEVKVGSSINVKVNGALLNIGIVLSSRSKAMLDLTADQSISLDLEVKDKTHTDQNAAAIDRKVSRKKKRFGKLAQSLNAPKVSLFTDDELIKVQASSPEEEMEVAREMKKRGLL